MGEPTWNENVLAFGLALKGIAKSAGLVAKTIHPVVSTMLPKANLETSYRFGVVTNSTMEKRVYSFQLTMDREVNCLALEVCH